MYAFSEPLGINFEVLESLLPRKGLFIQIYFDGLCVKRLHTEYTDKSLTFASFPLIAHKQRKQKNQSYQDGSAPLNPFP